MATFQLQSSSPSAFPLFCSIFTIPTKLSNPHFPNPKTLLKPLNCTNNGALETPKPTRRGRKKQTPPPSSTSTAPTKKPGRPKKQDPQKTAKLEQLIDSDEDDMDFPYQDPPLICCFGAAQREFVPTVRVSSRRRHPDIYSTWKQLQWDPPEFVRAPGGPPSNVAISHVRLGGRAAFMGKVGNDEFGKDLVLTMNKESVQTRAVKFDSERRTGASLMKFRFEDGKMMADVVRDSAEDSLLSSELSIAVLKEVKVFIKFSFKRYLYFIEA